MHFGINFEDKNLNIRKENYAKINKRNTFVYYGLSQYSLGIYEDESCKAYTDDYCLEYQKKCLENYDLNMKYFGALKEEELNKELKKLQKKFIK